MINRVSEIIGKVKARMLDMLPDRVYLYLLYFRYQKQFLHLKHPKKYTEKIMWLKLHGNLETYTTLVDKYGVRDYIAKKLGEDYLIPLLGCWENFEDIQFNELPNRFVLKATHGSGYNFICKDKSKLDVAKLKMIFDGWMNENFFRFEREPQYKDIRPRIVCEEYMEDETGQLRDFKFYCANGRPKLIQVDTDRFSGHKSELLDPNWQKFTTVQCAAFGELEKPVTKPKMLKEMLDIATKLSKDFPFVRVDLYLVDDTIYFGELTFTPGSGIVQFEPSRTGDLEFARILDLDLNAYS
jgi:hypothetical protein